VLLLPFITTVWTPAVLAVININYGTLKCLWWRWWWWCWPAAKIITIVGTAVDRWRFAVDRKMHRTAVSVSMSIDGAGESYNNRFSFRAAHMLWRPNEFESEGDGHTSGAKENTVVVPPPLFGSTNCTRDTTDGSARFSNDTCRSEKWSSAPNSSVDIRNGYKLGKGLKSTSVQ